LFACLFVCLLVCSAAQKAEAVANAIFTKTRRILKRLNLADFDETYFEVLGAEHCTYQQLLTNKENFSFAINSDYLLFLFLLAYGPHSRARDSREVVLRLVAKHKDPNALMLFAKEFAPAATAMAPGITGAVLFKTHNFILISFSLFFLDSHFFNCVSFFQN
jgi:hypothetical protein